MQTLGPATCGLVDPTLAIAHVGQLQIVGDEEIFVAQHGEIDFGSGDASPITLQDGRQ